MHIKIERFYAASFMTTVSLAKIWESYVIPISPFKRENSTPGLFCHVCFFSYPSIIQHSTVQKYPAYHTLLEKHGFQCIVISAARSRFENTSPAHSANFENGMETGLNVLFSYDDRSNLFSLPYSASEI